MTAIFCALRGSCQHKRIAYVSLRCVSLINRSNSPFLVLLTFASGSSLSLALFSRRARLERTLSISVCDAQSRVHDSKPFSVMVRGLDTQEFGKGRSVLSASCVHNSVTC